jgi:hypothetical protein
MPLSFKPKPENIMVRSDIHQRVVELAHQDRVRGVRLLREETGLPLKFAVTLIDYWLQEEGRQRSPTQ